MARFVARWVAALEIDLSCIVINESHFSRCQNVSKVSKRKHKRSRMRHPEYYCFAPKLKLLRPNKVTDRRCEAAPTHLYPFRRRIAIITYRKYLAGKSKEQSDEPEIDDNRRTMARELASRTIAGHSQRMERGSGS